MMITSMCGQYLILPFGPLFKIYINFLNHEMKTILLRILVNFVFLIQLTLTITPTKPYTTYLIFNYFLFWKICNIRFLDPDMRKKRNNFSVNNIYCVIKSSQTTQLYITKVFYIQFN
jgi:hypothetical protein